VWGTSEGKFVKKLQVTSVLVDIHIFMQFDMLNEFTTNTLHQSSGCNWFSGPLELSVDKLNELCSFIQQLVFFF
jgi:heat shock protein HslJ